MSRTKVPKTHVRVGGQLLPLIDTAGERLSLPPWQERSYILWRSARAAAGLQRLSLEMYLDACGYCTTCQGRGQVTDIPRPVFGEPIKVFYRKCPAKCRKGRVRNAWEPWLDPETGKYVEPTRYTPDRKNIRDPEEREAAAAVDAAVSEEPGGPP